MPSTKKSSRRSSRSGSKRSSRSTKNRIAGLGVTDILLIVIVLLVLYFVLAENGKEGNGKRLFDVGLDLDVNLGDTNVGVDAEVALDKDNLTGNLGVNIGEDRAFLEGDVDFGDKHKYGAGAYLGVNEDLYGVNLGYNSKRNKPYLNVGEIEEGFSNLGYGPASLKPNDNEVTLALFHAEWCGHCKKFMPTWEETVVALNNKKTKNGKTIKCVSVEADNNQDVVKTYDVSGYPTIMVLKSNGDKKPYNGERTTNALKTFVENNA